MIKKIIYFTFLFSFTTLGFASWKEDFQNHKNEKNVEAAFQVIIKAAKTGEPEAMQMAGYLYYQGEGVQKNLSESFKWFQKAANKDLDYSMNFLGLLYLNGEGVKKDIKEALKWFMKAAEKNNKNAQFKIAKIYYNGESNIPKNNTEAAKYFKRAADNGHVEGSYHFALMSYQGQGIEKNIKDSFKYFKSCADAQDPDCLHAMGILYFKGEGATKDIKKSKEYFEKSVRKGNKESLIALGNLELTQNKNYRSAQSNFRKFSENSSADSKKRVEQSLKTYFKLEDEKNFLLFYSVFFLSPQETETAAEKCSNINAEDQNGMTALLIAIELLDFEKARVLVRKGANVNKENKSGVSAFKLAAVYANGMFLYRFNLQLVELMLQKGANIKIKDSEGNSILHLIDNETIIKKLVQMGLDIETKNNNGLTPLEYAYTRYKNSIVSGFFAPSIKSLIKSGAKHKLICLKESGSTEAGDYTSYFFHNRDEAFPEINDRSIKYEAVSDLEKCMED